MKAYGSKRQDELSYAYVTTKWGARGAYQARINRVLKRRARQEARRFIRLEAA